MARMYSDSQLNITTQVLEYDRGGGGRAFSFSSNTPTGSPKFLPQQKQFRRGDINPSDGRIFWCYERDKRKDGSVHVRERWVTPEQFEQISARKRQNDRNYVPSEATKQKRKALTKAWSRSERGRALIAAARSKPENRERRRKQSKEYNARPEAQERRRQYDSSPERKAAARARYERLKQDPDWIARNKQKSKEWRAKNPERFKELRRRWHERNPGRANDYIKRRYAEDPQFALGYKVRARVYQAVKAGGASKTGRTEELVGCSFDFLRQHIERQFKGKMSWDNPSSFHIDHIVPLASFDLTDPAQLKVACNWQNLRPIPPKKNMSKGAKLTEPQLPLPLTIHSTTTYSL